MSYKGSGEISLEDKIKILILIVLLVPLLFHLFLKDDDASRDINGGSRLLTAPTLQQEDPKE